MAADQSEFLRTGLRVITPGDEPPTETECTICLEELQQGQHGIDQIQACGHAFHAGCLLSWLNSRNPRHSSCPNCRLELFPTRHPIREPPTHFEQRRGEYLTPPTFNSGTYQLLFENLFMSQESFTTNSDLLHTNPVREHTPRSDLADHLILERARRTIDGSQPLPACVAPHPTTGVYITVRTRFQTYWEQFFENGGLNDATRRRELVEDMWNRRSRFACDVQGLESLRLMLGPFSDWEVANGAAPNIQVSEPMYKRYGTLLKRLMPLGADRYVDRDAVIESLDHYLAVDASLFSLFTPEQELEHVRSAEEMQSMSSGGLTVEQRQTLVEDVLRPQRLRKYVDSGVYRHYPTTGIIGRAFNLPFRTRHVQNEFSSVAGVGGTQPEAPTAPSRRPSGRSPFLSPDHEAMSSNGDGTAQSG
ncbi:hypothetical protein BDW02DRAFT_578414 [Decorospora gaudefroyi]|uniref:RING-type domain-containing protein n=1 Tax=Decorospora gaudefroyi TaxID=184978 RepID=A0A6A5KK44_9PLEO|nr:hypothetical protein BDW02DRAFT_578414 [Decorospora gaudefroyi]